MHKIEPTESGQSKLYIGLWASEVVHNVSDLNVIFIEAVNVPILPLEEEVIL
jgi:hypothetical protein